MSTKLYTQILHLLAFVFVAVLTGMGTIALDVGLGLIGTLTGVALGLGTSYVNNPPATTTVVKQTGGSI